MKNKIIRVGIHYRLQRNYTQVAQRKCPRETRKFEVKKQVASLCFCFENWCDKLTPTRAFDGIIPVIIPRLTQSKKFVSAEHTFPVNESVLLYQSIYNYQNRRSSQKFSYKFSF